MNKRNGSDIKQKSHNLVRMVQILQKNSLLSNFEYFKTYTQVKRRISQIDTGQLQILQEQLRKSQVDNSMNKSEVRRRSLLEVVQAIKAKNIADQLDGYQYESTKAALKHIIELERNDKIKKTSLKEKKIAQKSQEEKVYELCLLGAFLGFIVSIAYTIIFSFEKRI